jgi:3-ketosteroid 9alpha-monooxygenase subunit B
MNTTKSTEPAGHSDAPAVYELTVARVIRETADACSLVLEIPDALRKRFHYRAGQFLTLEVPYDGHDLLRCYSLASSPDCESDHKITIKRIPEGRISNWVNDEVRAGAVLRVHPPGGHFVLNEGDNDVAMFAAGSGITPVISIVKTALATTGRRVRLLYANRDEASVIFKQELDELAVRYPERFELVYSMDVVDGFVTARRVKTAVGHGVAAEFYVCGPAPFMDAVESALGELGVAEERIHIERFVSPPDHDEQADAREREAVAAAGDKPDHLTVYLDGTTHEVPYEAGQTVLVAVQKAGLEPPFSCTDGFCGCCMARVSSGEVKMIHNDFLSKKELEQGWVLTCQSVPTVSPLKIEYPD